MTPVSKLTQADAQEWLESLQQVGEGWYRQVALAVRANAHKALDMDRREFARQIGQRMIDPRNAIIELHREGHSETAIADILGVARDRTVHRVLVEEGLAEPPKEIGSGATEVPSDIGSDATDELLAAPTDELEVASVADAQEPPETRIESLPDDLAERVRSGDTALDEAEQVSAEREQRVSKYVREVCDALDLLSRMVGHPVPEELQEALSSDQRKLLSQVLSAMNGGTRRARTRA